VLGRKWEIWGRILDEETGLPVKGKVKAGSKTTTTWEEGSFVLHLSPTERVQVQILPEDPRWEEVTFELEYRGEPETHLGEIILKPREATSEK